MNNDIMRAAGFGKEVERKKRGLCVFCNTKPGPFRDAISLKEHFISGICQKCQDKVFETDPDE